MKRIVSFTAALLVLLGAVSCEKENVQDSANVTFNIELPDNNFTRAEMADGSTVDELVYEVYVGENVMYEGTVGRLSSGKFTVELNMVTGMEYDLLFWAQKKGEDHYNTENLKKVIVNYATPANDESRDAFYGSCLNFVVGKDTPPTVTLTRPFAQVNFLSSPKDWKATENFVKDANGDMQVKSMVTFPKVHYLFDVEKGDVIELEYTEANFTLNLAPVTEKGYTNDFITINGEKYAWVSMNYILAPKDYPSTPEVDGVNIDAKAGFVHLKNAQNPIIRSVPQIPVVQNYRTNIIGEVFTEGNTFQIVVLPGFTDDNIVTIK